MGKCKAMLTGVKKQNPFICILDGDGQNPPYEAKKLMIFWRNLSKLDKEFALICGNRTNRQDNSKTCKLKNS